MKMNRVYNTVPTQDDRILFETYLNKSEGSIEYSRLNEHLSLVSGVDNYLEFIGVKRSDRDRLVGYSYREGKEEKVYGKDHILNKLKKLSERNRLIEERIEEINCLINDSKNDALVCRVDLDYMTKKTEKLESDIIIKDRQLTKLSRELIKTKSVYRESLADIVESRIQN